MTTHTPPALHTRKIVVWISRAVGYLVYAYLLVVEVILLLGFFLLLFGANADAEFTQWAYRNLDRVMQPFRGIFTPIHLGTTNGDVAAVFDTSVLFAMIVYGILALAFSALISWLNGRLRYLESAEAEVEARAAADAQAAATAAVVDPSWAPPSPATGGGVPGPGPAA